MKTSLRNNFLAVRLFIPLAILGALVPVAHSQVTFNTPPTWLDGTGPIFVADFNGKPSILSASGNLGLGNGNGTFTPGTTVSGTTLAVADFNGDGKPDLLQLGTGSLQVLLGNGDGTFQAPVITNIGATLTVVAAADLNGDGKADAVGIFSNSLYVYLSNGDGTFAAGVPYSLGTIQGLSSALIEFGDFNSDQKTDVALIVSGAPGEEIALLGNGDGTLQTTLHTSVGVTGSTQFTAPVVLGDFNGDGKLDIATLEINLTTSPPPPGTVSLMLGNGDGTFQAPTAVFTFQYSGVSLTIEPATLAAADVNNDGKLDLVVVGDAIGVYLGNGNGTFSSSPSYYDPFSPGGFQIAIADFNLDGKPDIAIDGQILLGNGNGTFQGIPAVLLQGGAGPDVVGAFVKNGAPGVAVIPSVPGGVNPGTSLQIWANDGAGNLTLAHTYTLPQPGYVMATADVNGDGNLDLVVEGADPTSQDWSYMVLLGNGDGSFQTPVLHQQAAQATELAYPIVIADFNNDHKLDLAFAQGNQTFAVLLGNGDGTFGAPSYVFDGDGGWIVSADFNGDGNQDIAEGGASGLALVPGNGNGTFQNATFPYTSEISGLLTGDMNGDGKVDLIGYGAGIQVLLSNGNGTFNALAPLADGDFSPDPLALADFNGDGKLDVLAILYVGSVANDLIYLGNGDGTFDPSQILVPYVGNPPHVPPQIIQVADMNGDGKPDLVVESHASTMFVLLNTTVSVAGASFSPNSVTFPSQQVGSSSSSTPVTLTNTGAIALTVTGVTLAGANAGEFTQTNNCTTVQPLTTCTINVTFTPTAAGAVSANLAITDNAGTGSQIVTLSGTGTAAPDFTIGMASGSNSSTISAGQTATFSLALTPAGIFSGTVNLTCSLTPAVTPAPVCSVPASVTITGGSASSVTVTVATTAAGSANYPPPAILPPGIGLLAWTLALGASGWLFVGKQRRRALPATMTVLAITLAGCGGSSSSMPPSSGSKGTPAGTYTATITATSGSLSHQTILTVTVQ